MNITCTLARLSLCLGARGHWRRFRRSFPLIALAELDAPCILFNLNGFYDDLRALLNRMSDMGHSLPRRQRGIHFAHSLEEVTDILAPLH